MSHKKSVQLLSSYAKGILAWQSLWCNSAETIFHRSTILMRPHSASQSRESMRMVVEKMAAFSEAWARAAEVAIIRAPRTASSQALAQHSLNILNASVKPIARRAKANAHRLRKREKS